VIVINKTKRGPGENKVLTMLKDVLAKLSVLKLNPPTI
jgi:hypothetical protein